MMIKINGASDDLIEIDGDIIEEFTYNEDGTFLGFSDGTILQVTYGFNDKAIWRITPILYGSAKFSKVEATNEDENYSDVVTLEGEIKWVLCGGDWSRAVA